MSQQPISKLETHEVGTAGLNAIINGNWEQLEDIFDPALSNASNVYKIIWEAFMRSGSTPSDGQVPTFNTAGGKPLWATPTGGALTSQVVIQSKTDFGTIDASKVYIIDGNIDMGTTSLEIPAGGITIVGFGADISSLFSTENAYTMFTSVAGGCGNIHMRDLTLSASGTTSMILDVTGDTGSESVTFEEIVFEDCTAIGEIDGFRQGLEVDNLRTGGTPTITFSGTWSGGYRMNTTLARSLGAGMTGALFEEGTSFTMASRFKSDMRVDLPASASLLDFNAANFTNSSSLQLDGCQITRGGAFDPNDVNYTPNIGATELQCAWANNHGLPNTFEGGEIKITSETATTISTISTYVDLAGTWTPDDLQHFDEPANGQLRNLGSDPVEYRVLLSIVIDGAPNDEISMKIVKWDNSAAGFVDVATQLRTVDNNVGGNDVAYFNMFEHVHLDVNDFLKMQVANTSNTNNVTAKIDSKWDIEAR